MTKDEINSRLKEIYDELKVLFEHQEKLKFPEEFEVGIHGPPQEHDIRPWLQLGHNKRYGLLELSWYASQGCSW
jgi:hypothetical protein